MSVAAPMVALPINLPIGRKTYGAGMDFNPAATLPRGKGGRSGSEQECSNLLHKLPVDDRDQTACREAVASWGLLVPSGSEVRSSQNLIAASSRGLSIWM